MDLLMLITIKFTFDFFPRQFAKIECNFRCQRFSLIPDSV